MHVKVFFPPDIGSICLKYVCSCTKHNKLQLQDSFALNILLNLLSEFLSDEIYMSIDCISAPPPPPPQKKKKKKNSKKKKKKKKKREI